MFTSPLELVFLLDVSESLSSIDINRLKTLIKETLATFVISPENVRVAFVLSGVSKEKTNKVVSLTEGTSAKIVNNFVDSISKGSGERNFMEGLQLISSEVLHGNVRKGALIIALTGVPFPNNNEQNIYKQLLAISKKYNLLLAGINKQVKPTVSYGNNGTTLTYYVDGRDIPDIYAKIFKSLASVKG